MASNHFGNIFKVTTFGESHGSHIGVVIDGCPSGIAIENSDINEALKLRAPGRSEFASPRKEPDEAEIISGVFNNKTTGAPICILIKNHAANPELYHSISNLLRPGHANFTYLAKYGNYDYMGGGRASARETAARVAASVFAAKILPQYGISPMAYLKQVGEVDFTTNLISQKFDIDQIYKSQIFCPDPIAEAAMILKLKEVKASGDSIGGTVEFFVANMPVGLGEPVYDKLHAKLAYAMLSIPGAKGFEIGVGMQAATMQGSEFNDLFILQNSTIKTRTNNAGGVLGGISNGMPLVGRVAFKPTSSIFIEQQTLDLCGNNATIKLPKEAKHDVCVAIRAVPVVNAMLNLVLLDFILIRNQYNNLTC